MTTPKFWKFRKTNDENEELYIVQVTNQGVMTVFEPELDNSITLPIRRLVNPRARIGRLEDFDSDSAKFHKHHDLFISHWQ